MEEIQTGMTTGEGVIAKTGRRGSVAGVLLTGVGKGSEPGLLFPNLSQLKTEGTGLWAGLDYRSPSPSAVRIDEDKKKQRLAKLAAWKNKQAAKPDENGTTAALQQEQEAEPKAWYAHSCAVLHCEMAGEFALSKGKFRWQLISRMPWEDPTAVYTAAPVAPGPPPRLTKVELPTVALVWKASLL